MTTKTRSKRRPSQKRALSLFAFSDDSNGLQSFTKLCRTITSSNSLKTVLAALDLTFDRFGQLIAQTDIYRGRAHFSKTYISLICAGARPVSARMLAAIAQVITAELSTICGQPIGALVTRNSPWTFQLAKRCPKHGRYLIDGRRQKCPICHH